MIDFFGRPLEVGQYIIYAHKGGRSGGAFTFCAIEKLNPEKQTLVVRKYGRTSRWDREKKEMVHEAFGPYPRVVTYNNPSSAFILSEEEINMYFEAQQKKNERLDG